MTLPLLSGYVRGAMSRSQRVIQQMRNEMQQHVSQNRRMVMRPTVGLIWQSFNKVKHSLDNTEGLKETNRKVESDNEKGSGTKIPESSDTKECCVSLQQEFLDEWDLLRFSDKDKQRVMESTTENDCGCVPREEEFGDA